MLKTLSQNLRARFSTPAAAGIAIAVAIGGVAGAITSTDFTYSPARQGYLSIHPMDLAPDNSSSANNYDILYLVPSLSGSGCYNTGLHLPQGAKIQNIAVWYSSNDANTSFPTYQFHRNALSNGANTQLIANFLSSDTGTRTLHYSAITQSANTIVNNAQASYGIGFCVIAGDRFYGARIGYSYNSAGD